MNAAVIGSSCGALLLETFQHFLHLVHLEQLKKIEGCEAITKGIFVALTCDKRAILAVIRF